MTQPHLQDLGTSANVHLDDNCDECGRPMELTGDSLCRPCARDDEARRTCIVCGGVKWFLEDETCSDACDARLAEWPEP